MDESIVLNDISLFYLEASEYINENIIDLGDDHQLFLEEEKKGFWAKVWDGIKKFFQTIWNWIKKAWNWLFGKGSMGKAEKTIDSYESVIRKEFQLLQKAINSKNESDINQLYSNVINDALNPAENWDIDDHKAFGNFKLDLTKDAQILKIALKSKAKEFVDKKLSGTGNSFEGKWNFLKGMEELAKNQVEYYDKNLMHCLFLGGLYAITIIMIDLSTFLNNTISYLFAEFKNIDNETKKRFNEFKKLFNSQELTTSIDELITKAQKLFIIKFYASFGFITADKLKKLYDNINPKSNKLLAEQINEFIENKFKSPKNTLVSDTSANDSYQKFRKLVIGYDITNINEIDTVENYIEDYFNKYKKGVNYSSKINELVKQIEVQNEIPESEVMEILKGLMTCNKAFITLFNATQTYLTINRAELTQMELSIARSN